VTTISLLGSASFGFSNWQQEVKNNNQPAGGKILTLN